MTIRTVDQLLDRISREYAWRIREIAVLYSQCSSENIPPDAQRTFRRSFLVIVYAHWEGFVKKSSHCYLEYVATKRLKLSELNWSFSSLFLCQKYSKELGSNKSFALEKILQEFVQRPNDLVKLQYKNVVPERSNLDSKLLIDICRSLSLDYTDFQTKELFISDFLGRRNRIAHGKEQDVDKKDVDSVKDEVIRLIDCFRNKIENTAIESGYSMHVS